MAARSAVWRRLEPRRPRCRQRCKRARCGRVARIGRGSLALNGRRILGSPTDGRRIQGVLDCVDRSDVFWSTRSRAQPIRRDSLDLRRWEVVVDPFGFTAPGRHRPDRRCRPHPGRSGDRRKQSRRSCDPVHAIPVLGPPPVGTILAQEHHPARLTKAVALIKAHCTTRVLGVNGQGGLGQATGPK